MILKLRKAWNLFIITRHICYSEDLCPFLAQHFARKTKIRGIVTVVSPLRPLQPQVDHIKLDLHSKWPWPSNVQILLDFYLPVWKTDHLIVSPISGGPADGVLFCPEHILYTHGGILMRSCVGHMNQVKGRNHTLSGHWKMLARSWTSTFIGGFKCNLVT
jgi:hypothetical protein